MFADRIAFKHWVFEVPSKLTRKIYSNTLCGYSEFHIREFKSYFHYQEAIFTLEIRELLNKLGIDYQKDTFLKVIRNPEGGESFVITYQFLGSMEVRCPERMSEPFIIHEPDYETLSTSTRIAFYQMEEKIIGKEIIYAEIVFIIPVNGIN